MARRQLAVALLLPEPVTTEIDGLRRAVGDTKLDRIAPHITLVPPANVAPDDLATALAIVRRAACDAAEPLSLSIGPPATFLPDNPVLYLAVGGDDLTRLLDLRAGVFQPPLTRPVHRRFVPHVTLATGMDPARLEAGLAALGSYRVDVVVDAVHVLEHQVDPDGRRYWRPVADAGLAGPVVVGRGGLPLELSTVSLVDPEAAAAAEEWGYPIANGATPGVTVVARRDGAVVGIARSTLAGTLSDLVVAPNWRREGIASHLRRHLDHALLQRPRSPISHQE